MIFIFKRLKSAKTRNYSLNILYLYLHESYTKIFKFIVTVNFNFEESIYVFFVWFLMCLLMIWVKKKKYWIKKYRNNMINYWIWILNIKFYDTDWFGKWNLIKMNFIICYLQEKIKSYWVSVLTFWWLS